MKRVIIESPYAGDIKDNTEYLKRCLRDSINRGEAPLASHLLYPFVLREDLKDERQLGIELGYEWWYGARCIVFYIDKGWSSGMLTALERAKRSGKDIEFRKLNIFKSKHVSVTCPETVREQKGSWLKRWLRAIWSEPSYEGYSQALEQPSARQAESCGKNSEPRETLCNDGECGWSIPHTQGVPGCIYEREPSDEKSEPKPTMDTVLGYRLVGSEMPDTEQQAFINSTLSRDAPSPVPWGEANDLK